MAHILELSDTIIRDALYDMALPPVVPVVTMDTISYDVESVYPDGSVKYKSTFSEYREVDLSDRISDDGIKWSMEKPKYPGDDDGLITTSMDFAFENPTEQFSASAIPAGLLLKYIERGKIYFDLHIEGTGYATPIDLRTIPMFVGKILGPPTEDSERTTFKTLGSFWDLVQKEVVFDSIPQDKIPMDSYIDANGTMVNNSAVVYGWNDYFELWDAYIYFGATGTKLASLKNSGQEKIDLLNIEFKSGAKLGLYTIKFIDNMNFYITFPDNVKLKGNVISDFESDYLNIPKSYWNYPGGSPLASGVEISFRCSFNASGNPITIAAYLVLKALTQQYGVNPFFLPGFPAIWEKFKQLETQFRSFKIFVSESNLSNDVFNQKANNLPLSYHQLIQKVLDHVNCDLVITPSGEISIQSAFFSADTVHTYDDSNFIQDVKIKTQTRYNVLTILYGGDIVEGSSSFTKTVDFRAFPDQTKYEMVINLPYYKGYLSTNKIKAYADWFVRKRMIIPMDIEVAITRNAGMVARPGDRFKLISDFRPKLNEYVEVISLSSGTHSDSTLNVVRCGDDLPSTKLCTWKPGDKISF